MQSLEAYLKVLKSRLVERTVYTRNNETFEVSPREIPPIIAPAVASPTVYNTEHLKKSVYLSS